MSRSIVIIASVAGFLSAGPIPVSWGDAAADLRKKIENVQESYDSALKEYNDALRAMSRYESDLEAAEAAVERRRGEMEAALEELKEVQEFSRDRSDISDAKEKEAYAAAKAAHEKARMALGEKTEQLHEAKSSATSALTALKGYRGELGNLNRQVSAVRFRKLQESLSRESTVTARGEFGCEEVTVRQCRDGTLELAKRSAVEQASAVILESSTVLEEFRTFIGSEAVAEDRQMMKERIESHVTGILVSHRIIDKGWIGETGYFYEIEAVVKGQVSEEFFGITGADDLPVPPEPEEAMTLVRADVESEQAHDVAIGSDPATAVLRLRDRIRDTRDRIETLREAGLQDAQEVYEGSLAAIGPKDMFETEAEYHARDAREKGDAAIARAKARSEVNRKYDGLLSEEVEPLLQHVNELLGSADVIHDGAILTKLEKYDPEKGIFVGTLEIDSTLIQMKAEMIIPMNRESARDFWEHRDSLVGRALLTIDSHSLEIGIDEFWLEDPESGSRTKERISIIEVRRPSSAEELKLAQGLSASAADLASRSAEGTHRSTVAKGWIVEYNRLVGEAKSVFLQDPHIQGLRSLSYGGDTDQAPGSVATASRGLETYMKSFKSNEALNVSAAGLASQSAGGTHRSTVAKGWIVEYNRLVGEAKSVFPQDPHIQGLRSLSYGGDTHQASGSVATASRGLETYMKSFKSNEALNVSAAGLASQSAGGTHRSTVAKGWIVEYNRLIGEAKSVFLQDSHIQGLRSLSYSGDTNQASGAVTAAAKNLAKAMENIEERPWKDSAEEDIASNVKTPDYTILEIQRYSGRFSPDAIKLSEVLGRWFSPDIEDENGWTDLHYAAALNLPGLASGLLDAGADKDAKLKNDEEPLLGNVPAVLRIFGRELNEFNRFGYTPLHMAAWFNSDLVAPHLVLHDSEIDHKSSYGFTPLIFSAWNDSRSVAEFLIGQGADIEMQNEEGRSVVDFAIETGAADTEALLRHHGGQCRKFCQ